MGIPKFYRWLSERYPLINVRLDGTAVSPPVDNLYLDMNSIIHNCAREELTPPGGSRYKTPPLTTISPPSIYLRIFRYINMLFSLVHPRRLVYLAVDGVAPRAKMNQQRGRRFRSWKEREQEAREKQESDVGYRVAYAGKEGTMMFDSNCITPGTEFMAGLTEALRYFVERRVSEDEAWGRVKVVLSGAETPGEGEHKIMQYIRAMKMANAEVGLNHCIYGLDADLIVLGLVTHEPNFLLLREKVDYTQYRRSGGPSRVQSTLDVPVVKDEFELLSINVLRDYIALDFGETLSKLPFFDLERVIDDFVLLMLFIGNDFLPNLPKIDIYAGSLNAMVRLYKTLIPKLGGYLSDAGSVDPDKFEIFVSKLALLERVPRRNSRSRGREARRSNSELNNIMLEGEDDAPEVDIESETFWEAKGAGDGLWTDGAVNGHLAHAASNEKASDSQHGFVTKEKKKNRDVSQNFSYYKKKVGFGESFEKELEDMKYNYIKGVCWVLKYYYEGVVSWRWYYPYHYAPMASDLSCLRDAFTVVSFQDDVPFRPMEQLVSVLPPGSGWCLPRCLSQLMTKGPLAKYFPTDFVVDLNGKRNDWEGVVLLPFIPEEDLFNVLARVDMESLLTEREKRRNQLGPCFVYKRDTDGVAKAKTVASPARNRLPDFLSIASNTVLELPKLKRGIGLRATGLENRPDLVRDRPTLTSMPYTGKLARDCGVSVFGFPSRNESMIIQLGRPSTKERDFVFFDSDSDEDEEKEHPGRVVTKHVKTAHAALQCGFTIGSHVITGYPWRCEGVLEIITDRHVTHEKVNKPEGSREKAGGANGIIVRQIQSGEKLFEEHAERIAAELMERWALDVGNVNVLFGVRKAKERNLFTSEITKYDDALTMVPALTVIRTRNESRASLGEVIHMGDVHDLFVGDRVLCLQKGRFYGVCGFVEKVDRDNVQIQFLLHARAAKEPPFAYRVVSGQNHSEGWMSMGRLARAVNLPVTVLTKVVGSIRVLPPGAIKDGRSRGNETDLGLGIKYTSRELFIPGYAKRDKGSFLYSNRTKNLIISYCQAFPDFIRMLTIRAKRNDSTGEMVFDASALFPGRNCLERLQTVAAWVGASEVASLPLVSLDSEVLPKATVFALSHEALIVRELQRQLSKANGGSTSTSVPRRFVVSARSSSAGLPQEAVRLGRLHCGDRVVNWKGNGSVPFGLRGTVVGAYKDNIVEVVFDEPFIDGGTLNGRCMENRGKAVDDDSLILVKPGEKDPWYTQNYTRVRPECIRRHGSLYQMNQKEETARVELASKLVQVGRSYAQVSKQIPAPCRQVPIQRQGAVRTPPRSRLTPAPPITTGDTNTASQPMETPRGSIQPIKEGGLERYPTPRSLPLPHFLFKDHPQWALQALSGKKNSRKGEKFDKITRLRSPSTEKRKKTTCAACSTQKIPVIGSNRDLQTMTDSLKAMIGVGSPDGRDGTQQHAHRGSVQNADVGSGYRSHGMLPTTYKEKRYTANKESRRKECKDVEERYNAVNLASEKFPPTRKERKVSAQAKVQEKSHEELQREPQGMSQGKPPGKPQEKLYGKVQKKKTTTWQKKPVQPGTASKSLAGQAADPKLSGSYKANPDELSNSGNDPALNISTKEEAGDIVALWESLQNPHELPS